MVLVYTINIRTNGCFALLGPTTRDLWDGMTRHLWDGMTRDLWDGMKKDLWDGMKKVVVKTKQTLNEP